MLGSRRASERDNIMSRLIAAFVRQTVKLLSALEQEALVKERQKNESRGDKAADGDVITLTGVKRSTLIT